MQEQETMIVGAGLAGSLLAIYLARRGCRVSVYEKRPDMRRTDIPAGRSINLALANRGMRALAEVGLGEEVRRLLIPMRGRMLHSPDGELQFQPYGQRPEEVIHSVSRAELNKLMMDAAEATHGVKLNFGQRCDDVDFETNTLHFTNESDGQGYRVTARTLLGADGAGSAIRRAMQQQLGVQASEEMLGHAYKELTIPPDLAGRHQMEPEALHIWPRGGFMLIALPNLDGSFTVTLFLPREGDPGFDQLADADRLTAFFRKHFADVVDKLPTLVEDFFTNPTGSLGTVRCRPWHHEGRVLLLGDAAHAIVPFHGQGMNCAFEDCLVLDRCLDAADGDWVRAFADYDQLRKLDADAIADMALENYVEMRDSVRDPGFRLRKELGFELERRYPDRFIPRYSMVMFHHLPYAEAQERGAVQARILKSLTEGVENLSDVDWNEADRLVNADLPVMPGD